MWPDAYRHDDWLGQLASTSALNPNASDRATLREERDRKAEAEARIVGAGAGEIPFDWGFECIADALERKNEVLDFEILAAAEVD